MSASTIDQRPSSVQSYRDLSITDSPEYEGDILAHRPWLKMTLMSRNGAESVSSISGCASSCSRFLIAPNISSDTSTSFAKKVKPDRPACCRWTSPKCATKCTVVGRPDSSIRSWRNGVDGETCQGTLIGTIRGLVRCPPAKLARLSFRKIDYQDNTWIPLARSDWEPAAWQCQARKQSTLAEAC